MQLNPMEHPIHDLKKQLLSLAVCLLMAATTQAQQLNYLYSGKDQKALDLKDFSARLSSIYRDSSVGWAYAIWKKGKLFREESGGFKITPADCLNPAGVPFLSSTRLHVASMSKTITAIAIAKLVDQKKIKWEDRAKLFLPSYWKLHPDFEDLTVFELVNMKSGLDAPLIIIVFLKTLL